MRGDGCNFKSRQIYHHKAWHWVGLGVGQYSRQKEQHLTGRRSALDCTSLLLVSRQVMSDSLQPYGLQHARPPCLSPSPGICLSSCPLSRWCYPTISSSVAPFSCLPSFAASGPFPVSRLFASGGRSIGASASLKWRVLPTRPNGLELSATLSEPPPFTYRVEITTIASLYWMVPT